MKRTPAHIRKTIDLDPKTRRATETLGWIGVITVLLAYALVTFGIIAPRDSAFALLNGIGAIGILVEAVVHRALPVAVLNAIWLVIALIALLRP